MDTMVLLSNEERERTYLFPIAAIEDGFADVEFSVQQNSMKAAGARLIVVGTDSVNSYRSKSGKRTITAEETVDMIQATDIEAIIIVSGYDSGRMR